MQPRLPFLTAGDLWPDATIRHGFFTRQGGVSGGLYSSLNCGAGSADAPENVRENRARVCAALGVEALAGVYQEHGRRVHVIRTREAAELRLPADGLATALPAIGLSILSADCAPVLFADPQARIIGAAHAGWKGALAGVCEAVLEAMLDLGAKRDAIRGAIGPCISQACYEVSADFEAHFLEQDPLSASCFQPAPAPDKRLFALGPYVAARLKRVGLAEVRDLAQCTYRDETRFFSFRRATHRGETDYGREISVISLRVS